MSEIRLVLITMVLSCVVVGCTNRLKKGSGLKFHQIPSAQDRRHLWLQAINRKNWTTYHSGDRVCGAHFISGSASIDPSDPDFVPRVNMSYKGTSMLTSEGKEKRFNRSQSRERRKATLAQAQREANDATSIPLEFSNNTSSREPGPEDADDEEEENHPQAGVHDRCTGVIMRLQREKDQMLQEIARFQEDLRETRQQLHASKFGESFPEVGNKNAKTLFLTGIPNYGTFLWLFSFCTSVLPVSFNLSPGHILLMVLMKLRLNLVDQDLAYRFHVPRASVSDIISKSLPVLADKFSFFGSLACKGRNFKIHAQSN